MSKKICRTCLKRTYKTYKTHENIHYPGETEQLKISDMLRYLIPELVSCNSIKLIFDWTFFFPQYLGVTTNPEICEECKSTLRSAYAFRKKCLATENLIGAYLKKSRCNASSIELIDVLIFLEQQKHQKTVDRNKQDQQQYEMSQVKAQEIISEWDDDASQEPNDLKELSTRKEVRLCFSVIRFNKLQRWIINLIFIIKMSSLFIKWLYTLQLWGLVSLFSFVFSYTFVAIFLI